MSWVSVARAVLVRLLFAVHGVASIWLLATVTRDDRYWYMASGLGLLLLELTVTLGKKGGKEWKWFCPSVFIYLMCVVPAIWFLELHEMDKRIEKRKHANLTMTAHELLQSRDLYNETKETEEELRATLGTVLGVNLEIRIPLKLKSEEWIKATEQLLLLLLILGRWLMPKGKLTHDQLSQLLLVYIGTAADIVEFFDAFKEDVVKYEPLLCMSILGMWSFSLIQFCLVLTAARARRDQTGLVPVKRPSRKVKKKAAGCCSADVYGIVISILLQDAPFLVLRMLLIFKYNVLSYTNMFFTSKNTIVIVLLIYRLIVVQVEKRRENDDDDEVGAGLLKERSRPLTESSSLSPSSAHSGRTRLVHSSSSYSNGFYVPSRATTPCRDDASMGSLGNITITPLGPPRIRGDPGGPVTGSGGGLEGGGGTGRIGSELLTIAGLGTSRTGPTTIAGTGGGGEMSGIRRLGGMGGGGGGGILLGGGTTTLGGGRGMYSTAGLAEFAEGSGRFNREFDITNLHSPV